MIFSITARNLKKDPCFKLCINSEPGGTPNLVPRAFPSKAPGTRLGTPHMKWVEMLVGNFELNP